MRRRPDSEEDGRHMFYSNHGKRIQRLTCFHIVVHSGVEISGSAELEVLLLMTKAEMPSLPDLQVIRNWPPEILYTTGACSWIIP